MPGKPNLEDQELFAFWGYDCFPWMLGARVVRFGKKGMVEPKGYTGYMFRPRRVVLAEEGEPLWEKIQQLREEHAAAISAVNNEFNDKLIKLFGEDPREWR